MTIDPLVVRACHGDRGALERVLAQLSPSVHRFGLRLCHNEADADDIVQDTLLLVAQHLDDFEGRSTLSSWAFALARSACTRRRRKRESRPALGLDVLSKMQDPGASPEDQLQARERTQELELALAELSREHREVIILRDLEGFSASDSASALDISVDALKSRLHRAREALRTQLQTGALLRRLPTQHPIDPRLGGSPSLGHGLLPALAPLIDGHVTEHLLDVTPAAAVRGLAAVSALDALTHDLSLLSEVLRGSRPRMQTVRFLRTPPYVHPFSGAAGSHAKRS